MDPVKVSDKSVQQIPEILLNSLTLPSQPESEKSINGLSITGGGASDIKPHLTVSIITDTNVTETENQHRNKWKRYIGLVLTILSAMMFSINALIFKTLKEYHPLTPAVWMFSLTAALAFIIYFYYKNKFKPDPSSNLNTPMTSKMIFILLARGFTGCSGMLFFFYSLQYLDIGDALVIACSSPIFVFLLAFFFLKESCGIIPVFTILMALIGVIIITRPPLLTGEESFKKDDLIGAAFAFASMLSIASTLILMRYLQDVHHSLINLIFGSWGTIQTLTMALAFDVLKFPKNIFDSTLMTTTGLLFFIGQTFLALALQYEEAGPVSLVRTSEVVFAFIWQFIFLNVIPDVFSLSGAVLIMFGIVTTIARKWVAGLPLEHPKRKTFGFILK